MRNAALLLATLVGLSLPALAHAEAPAAGAPGQAQHGAAGHGKHARGKHPHAAKTPKKGVDPERLRAEIEGRIARAKDRLEQHIAKKKVPAARAGAMRQEFNTGVLHVRSRMQVAMNDGVVTRDEARDVRTAARQIRSRR